MTRICLLGDSHAAALKRGWLRIESRFPRTEITFFAGDKAEWYNVHARDGRLVPDSERLREQFRRSAKTSEEIAADFDAYIVGSLGLGILMPLGFWASRQYPQWDSYRAAVTAYVRHSGCAHILTELRTISRAPILFVAAPFQPHKRSANGRRGSARPRPPKLRTLFEDEFRALGDAHDALFVPQLEETIASNGLTTRMEFAAVSRDPSRQDTAPLQRRLWRAGDDERPRSAGTCSLARPAVRRAARPAIEPRIRSRKKARSSATRSRAAS